MSTDKNPTAPETVLLSTGLMQFAEGAMQASEAAARLEKENGELKADLEKRDKTIGEKDDLLKIKDSCITDAVNGKREAEVAVAAAKEALGAKETELINANAEVERLRGLIKAAAADATPSQTT